MKINGRQIKVNQLISVGGQMLAYQSDDQSLNSAEVYSFYWAAVVAQLVEQSLPIPEVSGSNPVIGKKLYWTLTVNCIENTKTGKKRPGMTHLKNIV